MAYCCMTRNEIHKAITDYLALFENDSEAVETREERLMLALDRLALAYHFAQSDLNDAD